MVSDDSASSFVYPICATAQSVVLLHKDTLFCIKHGYGVHIFQYIFGRYKIMFYICNR